MIVQVNLWRSMDLTRLVLPGMLERSRGHVVNVASLAGKVPAPYLAAYSGPSTGSWGSRTRCDTENGTEPVGFSVDLPELRQPGRHVRHASRTRSRAAWDRSGP